MCLTYEVHVLYVHTCEFHVYWSVHLFCLTHGHVCFSYAHTSVTYAGNAIPFGILHSTYIRRPHDLNDMLVFVCMLSLFRCFAGSIAGSYAGSCSRTSRGATHFPKTNAKAVIPRGYLRRLLSYNPRRGHTHRRSLYTSRPARISPPDPVSFFLVLF